MALTKQAIPINFAQGLDTKTDPFQLSTGSFLALNNSVFTKGKRLTKRNGFGQLASLPFAASFVTTFNGDLTAVGGTLQAYASGSDSWVSKGTIQSLELNGLSMARSNANQSQSASAIAPNGFIFVAYADQDPGNLSNNICRYVISNPVTGQNIVPPITISNTNIVYGEESPYGGIGKVFAARVFLKKQRCSAFQINIQEVYDSSFGLAAGEGFTLSGLSLICELKGSFNTISEKNSVGTS